MGYWCVYTCDTALEMSQVSPVVTACKVEILNWNIISPNISSSALTYSHFDVAQHDILNYFILYLILNQGSVQQNLPQNWEWSETAKITGWFSEKVVRLSPATFGVHKSSLKGKEIFF